MDPTQTSNHWLTGHSLFKKFIWIFLGIAFICNTIALFIPFIEVTMVFKGTTPYNLLRTVNLLWETKLYILAIVVVFFSVLFPFVKLILLFVSTLKTELTKLDKKILSLLEVLAKWSTIDVFIVCFILALSNNQIFINAVPKIGIYLFLLAIIISLSVGNALCSIGLKENETKEAALRKHTWLYQIFLLIISASFIALLIIPFVEIDDWLLKDYSFNLIRFLWAIFQQNAAGVAVVLFIGTALLPLIELVLLWVLLSKQQRKKQTNQLAFRLTLFSHWSLLDVFLVSFIIFLFEGQHLITFKAGYGVLFLVIVASAYFFRPFIWKQKTTK